MIKQNQFEYYIFESNFLTAKKLKSFSIRKKINVLIYEFDLFSSMKIHSVIFVIHLKQIKKNEFQKKFFFLTLGSIIIDDRFE